MAALANAISDATGVRFIAPPFTPETIRSGLRDAGQLLRTETARSATAAA
jgi:nicotinate dehydrogenase subunit B